MAEPFLGEIRIMSFGFAPKGWAACDGQQLPINQNQALFALLGPNYGGNGQTTFALPNLQGRTPIHVGAGHTLAEAGGQTAVTLTASTLPAHVHALTASSANGNSALPGGALLGAVSGLYGPPTSPTTLHPTSVSSVGGSQPHENMAPYLSLNFCIALQGIFPSQN